MNGGRSGLGGSGRAFRLIMRSAERERTMKRIAVGISFGSAETKSPAVPESLEPKHEKPPLKESY